MSAEMNVNISAPNSGNALHIEIFVAPDLSGYATKAYVDEAVKGGVQMDETDPTVPEWAKQPEKPTYTAEDVGAQPAGDYALKSEIPKVKVTSVNGKTGEVNLTAADVGAEALGKLANHNINGYAHEDIRNLISALTSYPGDPYINSLIDTKIAAIPAAEGATF